MAATRWLSEIWGTPNICWVDADGGTKVHVTSCKKIARRRIILSLDVGGFTDMDILYWEEMSLNWVTLNLQ